jgi:hypothetical protein
MNLAYDYFNQSGGRPAAICFGGEVAEKGALKAPFLFLATGVDI